MDNSYGKPILFVILFFMCVDYFSLTSGFNIAINSFNHLQGSPDSYFGFSLAHHLEESKYWLLVGAPKHQTKQPEVEHGGSVFKCKATIPSCEEVPLDMKGNNIQYSNGEYVAKENKSHQWLGASVYSSPTTGAIVGCAPRYVYFGPKLDKREPVGNCWYLSPTATKSIPFSPCSSDVDNNAPHGRCQLGFAAKISPHGSRLFVGAVGSFYWQGQLFSVDLESDNNYPTMIQTYEGPSSLDGGYLGYSIALGNFSISSVEDIAVGIPRVELKGKVSVFRADFNLLVNITGEQIGEYFGYSLAVGDFNGDQRDDIVVGAPFYSEKGNSEIFDTGRVYVHHQGKGEYFPNSKRTILEGFVMSRFGTALANIGDINYDKIVDLAVGAPYYENHGGVFIYLGSKKGIRSKPSQIIKPKDLGVELDTFGFSLGGNTDMDGNQYPDVYVGAYESDSALILKTRPIVDLSVQLTVKPRVVHLDEKKCELSNGRAVICFTVEACLEYNRETLPSKLPFKIVMNLQSTEGDEQRIFFFDEKEHSTKKTRNLFLQRRHPHCQEFGIYVKNNIIDKMNPFLMEFSYELNSQKLREDDFGLYPILDADRQVVTTAKCEIWKNCGEDNICIPDLRLNVQSMKQYITAGSDGTIELFVRVSNAGEGAYKAYVRVDIPNGAAFSRVQMYDESVPVKCLAFSNETDYLHCDIGNPFPSGKSALFMLTFTPTNESLLEEYLYFNFLANSTNQEILSDKHNNEKEIAIPIVVETDIRLHGVSKPEQTFYNESMFVENSPYIEEMGPEITHLYEIHNVGPSSIEIMDLEIHWPSYFPNGLNLLYLVEQPQVIEGSGTCSTVEVNPRELQPRPVEQNKRNKRRFKREVKRSAKDPSDRKIICESGQKGCTLIRCTTGRMDKGESALVEIKSRVWVKSLVQEEIQGMVASSQAIAQVMKYPYASKADEYSIDTFQTDTYIAALGASPTASPISIWIIAFAISIGILLLILLICLLWKCGFFRRSTHDDMEELYTNGVVKERSSLLDQSRPTNIRPVPRSPRSQPRTSSDKYDVYDKYDYLPNDAY